MHANTMLRRVGLFLIPAVAGISGLVTVFNLYNRVPADQPTVVDEGCPGCEEMIAIPRTGDPEVDKAILAVALAKAERRMRAYEDAAQEQRRRDLDIWQGSKVHVIQTVSDRDRPLYESMADLFAADPPEPDDRMKAFADYFTAEATYRCVGWDASVNSVVPDDDGWIVTIRFRPRLMSASANIVFAPKTCTEKWHVSKAGDLTPLESVVDKSVGFIFTD